MAILFPSLSVSKDPSLYTPSNSSLDLSKTSFVRTRKIVCSRVDSGEIEQTHWRFRFPFKKNHFNKLQASVGSSKLSKELKNDKLESATVAEGDSTLFDEIKQRFLHFKEHVYMQNLEYYEKLADAQAPEFMVIACADSRVCPSSILGFQPGEAFVVRNVANMVPPYESGPSETNAALEFAVNSVQVKNILVIGHSKCGGIRALMSMHDDVKSSSFIGSWVSVGMEARLRTKAATASLNFDRQCKHCEKESVNCSLLNLLSYPWIEEKVKNGKLSIHGSYYDFTECTFEKWTLDYKGSDLKKEGGKVAVKNQAIWC